MPHEESESSVTGTVLSTRFQCHLTINNRLDTDLVVQPSSTQLPYGQWDKEPTDVPMKSTGIAFVATGQTGRAGCEGTVVYQVRNDPNQTITVYFNVPEYSTTNTVKATPTGALTARLDGFSGKGATESCVITVTHAQ